MLARPEKRTTSQRSARLRRFQEIDWDFSDEASESPFSDVHWHPCRFPSQIPALAVRRLTSAGQTVLDPFVGSGTTVVETQWSGRCGVGVDVNPIACLAARSKVLVEQGQQIASALDDVALKLRATWDSIRPATSPRTVQLDKWYTPQTGNSLRKLWEFIAADKGVLSVILQAAFSSILLAACRETRHWGYVCDNSKPKDHRERDVLQLYIDSLTRYRNAYLARDQAVQQALFPVEILEGNAVDVLQKLPSSSIDCIVTSPPYFGVADYVKSQRLSHEWFGQEIEPRRLLEIGARSKRHRRSAIADYTTELIGVFSECFRVSRKGAYALIILGQSPNRESAEEWFLAGVTQVGYRIESRQERSIRETRRQMPSILTETVLLLRKP
jgi:DNA modification methylase